MYLRLPASHILEGYGSGVRGSRSRGTSHLHPTMKWGKSSNRQYAYYTRVPVPGQPYRNQKSLEAVSRKEDSKAIQA